MILTLKIVYGPSVGDGNFNPSATYSGWGYDTDTYAVVPIAGTWRGTILDRVPPNFEYAEGRQFWFECNGLDETRFFYHRATGGGAPTVTTDVLPNSGSCGYTPPDLRTCLLTVPTVTVNDDTATVATANVVGPLEYSLDGGITRQTSNKFEGLSVGSYTAAVFDLGATMPDCNNTCDFQVLDVDPTAPGPAITPLPPFCFSGNPVVVEVQGNRAKGEMYVQVWVETAHHSGAYQLAFQAKKRSDADRMVRLEISDVLSSKLEPELDLSSGGHVLTQPIRNWFVRAANVSNTSGVAARYSTSNNSVVLLGGLPPEPIADNVDYFTTALSSRLWMHWQPRSKRVGFGHVEVLQLLQPASNPYEVQLEMYTPTGAHYDSATITFAAPAGPATPPVNAVAPPQVTAAQQVHLQQLVFNIEDFPEAGLIELQPRNNLKAGHTLRLTVVRDDEAVAQPRQLVFQNSLAGFDTIALFGRLTAKLQTERTQLQLFRPMTAGEPAMQREADWPTGVTTTNYSLNTGNTLSDWLEYLQELVTPGRAVYEVYQGHARAVVLTTKEVQTYQDAQGYTSAVIDYRAATRNNHYANYARNTNRSQNTGSTWNI